MAASAPQSVLWIDIKSPRQLVQMPSDSSPIGGEKDSTRTVYGYVTLPWGTSCATGIEGRALLSRC